MKKNIIVLFAVVFLMVPYNVKALTGNVSISCLTNEVKPGENLIGIVIGTSDDIVTAIEASVSTNDRQSVSIVSFEKSSSGIWHDGGFNSDGTTINVYAEDTNISGNFDVGTLKLKISDSTNLQKLTLNLTNVKFVDKDFNEVKDGISGSNSVSIAIKRANESIQNDNISNDTSENRTSSTNNDTPELKEEIVDDNSSKLYLRDLIIENYDIDFDKDTFYYTLRINDETELQITPIPSKEDTSFSILGNENLTNGSLIQIKLDDEQTNDTVYVIKIIKDDNNYNKQVTSTNKEDNSFMFSSIIVILVIINLIRIIRNRRKKKVVTL